ncbi:sulfur carrier protein ThiS adenylyltransferase ThiF [Bifidobacterium sp.]|jgi:sulfur carrier protein ThiS adenylyltransferase|uniref:sulfur carrier protein ThiS adenylyltransferase ThiF n=1 Tax=Bifidobacterium sp. TaxID=41200 RepID=UPI0025BC60E0|nr:sulfur carrier protein ThiS adenylyltransferase ThiF [Bifidobacterium sp.]MCH4161260.1 sulfur carrier protein ThiS adenylyltransferase ThiF [Bifidobacterium sp.]MCH4175821.1 sulfur carrier protein ThiS adenylyltransferase ThiF [Bifidobacterium sp.]MCI1635155.1 sulfur carrier protein ThiS adenylyltransferase ThiF [Bifidobacterium sp.]
MISQEQSISASTEQIEARRAAFNRCGDPKSLVSKQELQNALFERHTQQVQRQLDAAHVAIAGLGGLGSTIAVALTRIGVGHLHLVDFDRVDMSNLNRQQYFLKDLGQLKTEALRSNLAQINPYVEVRIDSVAVNEQNVASLFADDEIIAEAFDVPENKSILVNAVLEYLPHAQLLTASGMAGFGSSNTIETKRISEHFYFCGDGVTAPVPGEGLMAPRVGVVACHEANMITRLILGQNVA